MDDSPQDPQEKRTLLRTLMSPFEGLTRRGIAGMQGVTFRGKRDSYEALGYQRVLFSRDYRARYRRGGIAARLVEAMPLASWRGGGALVEDENPNVETEFEKAFTLFNTRMNVWQIFQRADILAGLGRYAIIVIGAPGDLQSPLTTCSIDQIKYLTPYAEDDAFITEYDQDSQSERFGLPVKYSLRRTYVQWPGQMNPPVLPAKPIHYSRCIHVADGLLDDHVFGTPRLERGWNLLDDLDKVTGGGAEAYWRRADGGTHFDVAPELEIKDADKDAFKKDLQEFTDEFKRHIVTRGVTMTRLGSDVADMKGPASSIIDQISATYGIPQRILMGSEMGKLASSKDKSNWDDHVQDRRVSFCGPNVIRPFVDRLIALGALPTPTQYEADWPETDELDQGQRVTAAVQISTINKNEGSIVVTPSEIRRTYLGLEPLTPEQEVEVQKIKDDKAQAAQDAMPPKAGPNAPPVPGAPPANDDPATLATAAARAVDAAVRGSRRALAASPALRAAVASGDAAEIERLLSETVDTVETILGAV